MQLFVQVLTKQSLCFAFQVICLSNHQSLRLGFNSLGAMASVNHMHWHLYYFDYELAIETLPVNKNILQNWPVPAIVFELTTFTDQAIDEIVEKVWPLIDFCLTDGRVAHNLFLSRTPLGHVRLFIWLSEPRFGVKDNNNINPAFCEFSGYVMCKTKHIYDHLDEQTCVRSLQSVKSVHEKVMHLL